MQATGTVTAPTIPELQLCGAHLEHIGVPSWIASLGTPTPTVAPGAWVELCGPVQERPRLSAWNLLSHTHVPCIVQTHTSTQALFEHPVRPLTFYEGRAESDENKHKCPRPTGTLPTHTGLAWQSPGKGWGICPETEPAVGRNPAQALHNLLYPHNPGWLRGCRAFPSGGVAYLLRSPCQGLLSVPPQNLLLARPGEELDGTISIFRAKKC